MIHGLSEEEKFKVIRPMLGEHMLGDYGMPIIHKTDEEMLDIENMEPVGIKNLTTKQDNSKKIVLPFTYDKDLLKYWTDPMKYIPRFQTVMAVGTPDYSIYPTMNINEVICLVFNVIDYDMLYPVEYVDKNKVDYTEMLIEAYNSSPKELFDNGMLMAELPYVIKNPDNESMKSYLEKEVRILSDPFGEGILNSGNVYPKVKEDLDYKGRDISYDKCGLALDKIIIGKNCDNTLIDSIMNVGDENNIIFQ